MFGQSAQDISLWSGIVAAIAAIVAIAVAVGISRWQNRRKILDVYVAPATVLRPNKGPARRLGVKPEQWSNLDPAYLTSVRFKNRGRDAILPGDFLHPLIIVSRQHPRIVTIGRRGYLTAGTFASLQPDRLRPPYRIANIGPFLLNPGEWFEVDLISDRPIENVFCVSRFGGQSRDSKHYQDWRSYFTSSAWILIFVFGPLFVSIALILFGHTGSGVASWVTWAGIIWTGAWFFAVSLRDWSKLMKRMGFTGRG